MRLAHRDRIRSRSRIHLRLEQLRHDSTKLHPDIVIAVGAARRIGDLLMALARRKCRGGSLLFAESESEGMRFNRVHIPSSTFPKSLLDRIALGDKLLGIEKSATAKLQDEMAPRDFIIFLQLLGLSREPTCLLVERIPSRAMAVTSVSGAGSRSVFPNLSSMRTLTGAV
jgi:hypothetical protein